MTDRQKRYIITKYCGGGANTPPARNIKIEFEDGYGFTEKKSFGKLGITIGKL